MTESLFFGAERKPKTWHLTPSQLTLLGFIALILLGAFLLWLPFSVTQPTSRSFLTALFTSTSAVCVTGLSVVDPSTYYTPLGQVILMALIQLGGLGYMTLYSLMVLAVGKRLSLRERFAMQQVLDLPGPGGVVRFVRRILLMTLCLEGLGLLVLAGVWIPKMGWGKGLFFALFHSVSAFNNAGFALFSDSLMGYQSNPVLLLTIATLVIFGGLGYPVLSELWNRLRDHTKPLRWKYLSLHTRVCLIATAGLLVLGTYAILFLELNNPHTLGVMSPFDKLLNAFFQSVMPRTAGFNALDTAKLGQATLFITLTLMFIGTNPGGTGGGIKTTTIAVLFFKSLFSLQGRQSLVLFQRKISDSTVNKAMATLLFSLVWINGVTVLLLLTEKKEFLLVIFEVVSAFATVGLSASLTPTLSELGQFLIILTMYAGRVGVITLGTAFWWQHRQSLLKYPEENLLVS
ncbi:MAG: TrkH family potassium uptake protein [Candidatus Sericytochromatia bacterium]